ncbi:MAG: glycoside hydrolase family 43 protein [Mucilaginibacter polytrichastri]|nr:glycoside hydrolase family 43 protein [Mucilaginibacter polytrichastri]
MIRIFICGLLLLLPGFLHAQKDTFTNPIGDGADPWVIKSGDFYYTCASGRGGIVVTKSAKLTEPGQPKQVWKPKPGQLNSHNIWAPELHHIGKKWYIYYAAAQKNGNPFTGQRSFVLESVSDDPQGAYTEKSILKTGTDDADPSNTIWAIDLTVDFIGKKLYAVWSGWIKNENTDKTEQHLYIAEMSNPWTIKGERVKISSPVESWETGGPLNLNEGPEFLKHNGETFIIYSTRESWTPEYRLGQLRLKNGADPLSEKSWVKTGPVFQGTEKVLGTGHASFTTSPDGSEDWIFYHVKKDTEPGWNRDMRLQKFGWKTDGSPDFGVPVPAGEAMKKPSGEEKL